MPSSHYFLSTLRPEDVREAKRNLYAFHTLHIVDGFLILSGSAIFPESFMSDTLRTTHPI